MEEKTKDPQTANGSGETSNGDDTQGRPSSLLQTLSEGFRYLRQRRDGQEVTPPPCVLPSFLTSVTVTVIDPSKTSISTQEKQIQLYDKFANIFEREYKSTLNFVNYQLFRNDSNGVIENLPVKTVVARSHGGGLVLPDDDTAKAAIHDYSWEQPYCYVYLAACESHEHYRTKVKPSIQAFVSQLEAAVKTKPPRQSVGDETATTPTVGTPSKKNKRYAPSPRYVIAYVPTGDRSTDAPTKGGGFSARLAAAARQRMKGADVSAHSMDSSDHDADDAPTLSKTEREISKRFAQDFPNGNVCTLCSLNEDEEENFQKSEWDAVLNAMGSAVALGFQDRCHKFDDELRKLDLQRRGEAKPDSDQDTRKFHLVNFFLVKESLAFTYEQMRLPGEALLQYEELRAFMPDPETDVAAWSRQEDEDFLKVALSGDVLEFRGILRSHGEFDPVIHVVEEYLFARELGLLFQMHKSVRIIKRCLQYVDHKFELKKSLMEMASNRDESLQQLIELNKRAFDFCWDFREASEFYLKNAQKAPFNISFTRSLCDLFEFARCRLVKLGELVVPEGALNLKQKGLVDAIQQPWPAWEEREPVQTAVSPNSIKNSHNFLETAVSSPESFLLQYLEVTKAVAECNDLCGRHRFAARLRIERMEMYDSMGETTKAAKEVRSIMNVYDQDMWSNCQFALLFRLAAFQRRIGSAREYLDVLKRCFNESWSNDAPRAAQEALHADLEGVLQSQSVKGVSYALASLFGPIFGLEGIRSTHGTDRSLLKRLYTVGDKVSIVFQLTSYLPKSVEVDKIAIQLVPFRVYVSAMEDNIMLKDSDIYSTLTLEKPSPVQSGKNEYTLDWLPKSAGQFILASAVISWNGVDFTYTAKELQRPTIRIDVVPGEATQKLVVNPDYLIPGHEQPVTFIFNAGSDVVEEGRLQIVGGRGLLLQRHKAGAEDPDSGSWVSNLEVALPKCPPSESVSVTAMVKVAKPDDPSASTQPLQAKAVTSYKYAKEEPGEPAAQCMETELECKVAVRTKPALSIIDSELVTYAADRGLLNLFLRCNGPATFTVKSWSIEHSRNVELSLLADLNSDHSGETIVSGDKLAFAFDCSCGDSASPAPKKLYFSVVLENEEGTEFREALKLDIAWPAQAKSPLHANKPVRVEMVCLTSKALVGTPVEFSYTIGCGELSSDDAPIAYSLEFDDTEWIISGKIDGVVDTQTSSCQVRVTAIPVRPGRIASFPAMSLVRAADRRRLPIDFSTPSYFESLAPQSHVSVAFPIGVASRRAHGARTQA